MAPRRMIHRTGASSIRVASLVVLVIACAGRQHNPAPVIHSLKIEGNHRLSNRTIKSKILTAETGWLPFSDKKYFDPLVWEADQRRIERLYEASGDYHARVVSAEVKPRSGNRVDLVLHLAEGQPVLVQRVQVGGLDQLPPPERDRAVDDLPIVVGHAFNENDWAATKRELRDRLRAQGYAETDVDGHADVDVGQNQARLRLQVDPGLKYRFGDIDVRTQPGARVAPWLIQEQVALALKDEVFSDDLLEEAQRRVFGMGVFSSARVRTGPPDRNNARLPVIVDAREGPFRTLKLGGGVGIDQVRNEARLISEWQNRDFLGRMRHLTAQLTLGWAFIPNAYSAVRNDVASGARNGPIFRLRVQLEQPRFFWRPTWKLKTLLETERTLEQSYDAIGGRAMTGVSWAPTTKLTIFPAYNIQGYRLNGPRTASVQAAPLALGCKNDPCTIFLSYLEEIATWDRRDSPLEPKRGTYLTLSLQEGGGPLQGDFTYVRVVPEARGYLTFGDEHWLTLAGRLQVGTLLPASGRADDSAVVTRFMGGGAMSMRGYSLRRLTPLLLAPAPNATGPNPPLLTLPIGGDGIVDSSFEARTNLTANLALALFADVGTVTAEQLHPSAVATLQYATGIGVRYLTPVGPIRLDIAFRLPVGRPPPLYDVNGREITYLRLMDNGMQPGRETGAHINKSCFGIGGSSSTTWVTDGLCVFHISIGEAF
jgi:translocation and assembly module TamA